MFPGAQPDAAFLAEQLQLLVADHGLDLNKSIAACSLCPDEWNNRVIEEIRKLFGHTFFLGGITGFPFTGVTGFNAFGDHIPDRGHAFIFYGPHMGIDAQRNGFLQRPGQERATFSCGAAFGALQQLKDDDWQVGDQPQDDYQLWRLRKMLQAHRSELLSLRPELKLLELIHAESRSFMLEQAARIKAKFQAEKIILLGAVVLNTPIGMPDYIQHRSLDIL